MYVISMKAMRQYFNYRTLSRLARRHTHPVFSERTILQPQASRAAFRCCVEASYQLHFRDSTPALFHCSSQSYHTSMWKASNGVYCVSSSSSSHSHVIRLMTRALRLCPLCLTCRAFSRTAKRSLVLCKQAISYHCNPGSTTALTSLRTFLTLNYLVKI